MLALLLESPQVLVEGHHFGFAGLALLALGIAKMVLGRRRKESTRSYSLWLLLGSGVCLIALGLMVSENTSPYLELLK
jgi:uncharacterized membrane protein HdeD (DUF308 family)